MAIFVKDPTATVDYAVDWSAGYLSAQEITSSVWQVAPAEAGGLVVTAHTQTPGKTRASLAGGRLGQVYRITNKVVLSDGNSDERMLVVRVEER